MSPMYVYRCISCQFEATKYLEKFTERCPRCPKCNGNTKRIIAPAGFILEGSGWPGQDGKKLPDEKS